MSGALDDITVLDLTRGFPAALSAAFLADFGGRVIRLELLPAAAEPNGAAGHGWNHEADLIHRNKESIALNPQTAEGRKILAGLAGRVDVILTDWLLPELAALGLDYATISAANPRIVYGRLSGFGPQGPDSALPAIDELAAARTGMMPILQQPGMPPVYTGAGQMHAMVMLGFGIVTALIHRQATGEGHW